MEHGGYDRAEPDPRICPHAQPVSLNGIPAGLFPQLSQYMLQQTSQLFATELSAGLGSARGGADIHPGLREQTAIGNNYNFPGGAKGSLVTSSFSLQGYTASDKPTLYVNYFLNTNDAGKARILGSRDGGQTWVILATNVEDELPEYISMDWNTGGSNPRQGRQPLFNSVADPDTGELPNAWRQVRIDLAALVGSSEVMLRFDFESPSVSQNLKGFFIDDIIVGFAERGEMVTRPPVDPTDPAFLPETGFFPVPQNPSFGAPSEILVAPYQLEIRRGMETQAPINDRIPFTRQFMQYDTNDRLTQGFSIEVPVGWAVAEGQLFTVGDGTNSAAFELVRSAELVVANGERFEDGDTFTLQGVTFEFDHDGAVQPGNVRVPIELFSLYTPADFVAQSLFAAIQSANLGLQATLDGNRIGLIDSSNSLSPIAFTPIVNSVAVVFSQLSLPQPGHVPVVYSTTQTEFQIANRIVAAINAQANLKVIASVRTGTSRIELDGALSLTSEVLPNPFTLPTTALEDYVSTVDPSFGYTHINTFTGTSGGIGYTVYILDMVSQTWRTSADVDPVDWQHYLQVIVPDTLTTDDSALLFIGGGSVGGPPPSSPNSDALQFAISTRSVVVYLPNVPNQPLVFTGDPLQARSEDEAIAYTFYQYSQDPNDVEWPLLLPMVKSAVRAMDATQEFLANTEGLNIEQFVVSGGSKRGWTTWLTAAVDDRVSAIIPFVFDALNLDEQMIHHRSFYANQRIGRTNY